MKIKFLEVIHGDCYEDNTQVLQVTDWEEVTEEEFQKLSKGLRYYNRYVENPRNLIMVRQLDLPTTKEILSVVDEALKKEQEKLQKKNAQKAKREKTRLANKKKKELEQLKILKEKYEPTFAYTPIRVPMKAVDK